MTSAMSSRRPFACLHCYTSFCDFDRFQRHRKRHTAARWQPKQHLPDNDYVVISHCETNEYSLAMGANIVEYSLAITGGDNEYSIAPPVDNEVVHKASDSYTNNDNTDDIWLTENGYMCRVCEKKFTTRAGLKRHVQRQPHKCNHCNMEFCKKGKLNVHLKSMHTGSKPFMCVCCCKQFSRKSDWKRHMYIHVGSKPFQCNSCTMSFLVKDALTKHTDRVHSTTKPYKCTYCGKSFSRTDDFGRHVRSVHESSNSRQFQCGFCGKCFKTKDHVSKHERTHTGDRPFGCGVCCKTFDRKYNLMRHINNKHAVDSVQSGDNV